MPPRAWWRRRSLRARLTLLATGALAVGLVAGSVVLAAGFARVRYQQVGRTVTDRAQTLADLADGGSLPAVLPVGAGEVAQVLDNGGRVVAASPNAGRTLAVLPDQEIAGLTRGRAQVAVDSPYVAGPLEVVAVASTLAGRPVTVVVAAPLGDIVDTLRTLRTTLLVAVPLLVLLVAAVSWLLVGSALRPVGALARGADDVQTLGGRGVLPVPIGGGEIAVLAATLNAMLDRLAEAGERQRGFVADAAHELRSPLASLRTQLEVDLALGDAPVATDLLADVLRLAALVDDLLVLARLDGSRSAATAEPVDLAALIPEGVETHGRGTGLGNPEALRRVLRNLLDNARRHADGRVTVTVAEGRLDVDDDGPGVPSADRERIFERFSRLDDARDRDAGGSGLGLAIARETARAAGGDVTVEDSPLGGARFTLRVPPR